jgi:hypothetical protein
MALWRTGVEVIRGGGVLMAWMKKAPSGDDQSAVCVEYLSANRGC